MVGGGGPLGKGRFTEHSREDLGVREEQLRVTADIYCQRWKLRDTGVLEALALTEDGLPPLPQPRKLQESQGSH